MTEKFHKMINFSQAVDIIKKNKLIAIFGALLCIFLLTIAFTRVFSGNSHNALVQSPATTVNVTNATDVSKDEAPSTDFTGVPGHGEHADDVVSPNDAGVGPEIVSLADKEVTLMVTLDAPAAADFLSNPTGEPSDIQGISKVEEDVKLAQYSVIDEITKITGTTPTDQFGYLVNGFQITTTADKMEQILALPGVKGAQEERLYHVADSQANDDGGVTAVQTAASSYGSDGAAAGAGYRGEGQVIAIIDTGVDADHRDLCISKSTTPKFSRTVWQDKIAALGYGTWKNDKVPFGFDYADFSSSEKWLRADDDEFHGMHVAGLAASNGNCTGDAPESTDIANLGTLNTDYFTTGETLPANHVSTHKQEGISNVTGGAPEAQIINLKVFSNTGWNGESGGAYDSTMIHAIEDAVKLGADVFNMSIGSVDGVDSPDSFLVSVVNKASELGVIPVISAGNSGSFSALVEYGDDHSAFKTAEDNTLGAPGVSNGALGVASSENNTTILEKMYLDPMFINQAQNNVSGTGCFIPRTGELVSDSSRPLLVSTTLLDDKNCGAINEPITDVYGNTEAIKSIPVSDPIEGIFSTSFKKYFSDPNLCRPVSQEVWNSSEKERCNSSSDVPSAYEDSAASTIGSGIQLYPVPDRVSYTDGVNPWTKRYQNPNYPTTVTNKSTPIAQISNDGFGTGPDNATLPGWGFPDDYAQIACRAWDGSAIHGKVYVDFSGEDDPDSAYADYKDSLPDCDPSNYFEVNEAMGKTAVSGKFALVTLSMYVRTTDAVNAAKAAGAKGIIFVQLYDDVQTNWGVMKETWCDSRAQYLSGDCFPVAMVKRSSGEKLFEMAKQQLNNVYQTDICSTADRTFDGQACADTLGVTVNDKTPVNPAPLNSTKMYGANGALIGGTVYPRFLTYSYHPTFISNDRINNRSVGRQPSVFTSWGASPTLELKPDVMATGGNLWSIMNICKTKVDTLKSNLQGCGNPNDSNYQLMSGTSMASPFLAGAEVLLVQHLKDLKYGLNTYGNAQFSKDARALITNTATPSISPNGQPYSPRRQGAGNVDIDAAVNSRVILRNTDNIEKDQNDGTFALKEINSATREMHVELENITGQDASYTYDGDASVLHEVRIDDNEAPFIGV
jgi:subtilisin family serine protease